MASKTYNARDYVKKSGAKLKLFTPEAGGDSRPCITAWNKSKNRGFISMIASPITDEGLKKMNKARAEKGWEKASFESVSKRSGTTYQRWVCTIEFPNRGEKKTMTGWYDASAKKLRVPNLKMVASTTTDYFGKSYMSKKRR